MRDIYFRQGVYGDKLNKPIRKTLPIVLNAYKEIAHQPFILITSTFESSQHCAESCHYVHDAYDVQLPLNRNFQLDNEKAKEVFKEIQHRVKIHLEPRYGNYDYVLHSNSHIHIEFDPE